MFGLVDSLHAPSLRGANEPILDLVFSTQVCSTLLQCDTSASIPDNGTRHGKATCPDIARAVHRMRAKAKSLYEIADLFGHTKSWVQHILRTFDDSGRRLLESRQGRPRKSTKEEDQKVLEYFRANRGQGLEAASRELSQQLSKSLSSETIRRRLKEAKCRKVKVAAKRKRVQAKEVQ